MSLVERIADVLGFEYIGKFQLEPMNYTHVRNRMPWYHRYGLFTKNYFFDRFQPRNSLAAALKLMVQVLWIFIYVFPIGMWLTFAGTIYEKLTPDPELPENSWRD